MPEVIFFPKDVIKGKNLGGGFIKTGGIQIRFAIFLNDKFSQGYSISFPIRKNPNGGEIIREVEFINREVEDFVYAQISPKVAHLIGRMPTQQAGGYQAAPTQQFQQGFNAPQSAPTQPKVAPVEEPKVIGGEQADGGQPQGDDIGW